jgi:hypothetical protein
MKVTLIVHVSPAPTLLPQVLVCTKSLLTVMLEMVRETVPLLDTVTVCAALVVLTIWPAKVRLVVDSCAEGAVPVPVRLTVFGLPEALSVNERLPARAPEVDGVKVTEIGQTELAATVPPQLSVSTKSPLEVMALIVSAALPGSKRLTICAPLVLPSP